VYTVTVVERTPHWHTWLIPRRADSEARGTAYLNGVLTGAYSTQEDEAKQIVARLQAAVAAIQ
jgi:hypothetical protein